MVIIILLALNSLLFPVGEIKRFQRTPQELFERIKIEAAEYKVITTTPAPPVIGKYHVAFLKVHKSGSTTAQNMFLRYGWNNNLTFVLPPNKNAFGYPNIISLKESMTNNNTLPPPEGKHFDILCNHVLYSRAAFKKFLPDDTFYIGIVREPYENFKSILNYLRPGHVFRIKSRLPGSEFLKNPAAYEPKRSPRLTVTRSRMAVEFGFPDDIVEKSDIARAQEYIKLLDEDFGLVIVAEYFEESIVLMKRYLNWSTKDIIYLDKNIALKKNVSSYVGPFDRQQYKKWAKIDYLLYDHFFRKLWDQIRAEGFDFDEELLHFKEIRKMSSEFCNQKPLSASAKLKVLKSRWSNAFEITYKDCTELLRGEIDFVQRIRERQYGSRYI